MKTQIEDGMKVPMKLNVDMIRSILIKAENGDYPLGSRIETDGENYMDCAYQVSLMIDERIVEGEVIGSATVSPFMAARIDRITSRGQDFLLGIKHDAVWKKAKAGPLESGSTCGLGFFIEWVGREVAELNRR